MKEKDKNVAYQVYVTKEYDKFKRLKGNRDIPETRIGKIVASIQEVGWIRNPIVVNEKMEVIDGQGRLTALQRLGLPVEYIIAEGAGTQECIYMNMNMVNWGLNDYVKSYAEQGNINYQRLLSLMQNYAGGNLNIIMTALYRVSRSKHKEIKDGSIQISEEQYFAAVKRLKYIQPFLESLDNKKLPGSIITLIQTLIYYFDYDEVDKDRLKARVEKYIYQAKPWVTGPDCEKEVEDVYNYRTAFADRTSIRHLITDERMRRRAEINEENSKRALARTRKGVQGFVDEKERKQLDELFED